MLTAEKALLSIRLDISNTEARTRRLQFRAVVANSGHKETLLRSEASELESRKESHHCQEEEEEKQQQQQQKEDEQKVVFAASGSVEPTALHIPGCVDDSDAERDGSDESDAALRNAEEKAPLGRRKSEAWTVDMTNAQHQQSPNEKTSSAKKSTRTPHGSSAKKGPRWQLSMKKKSKKTTPSKRSPSYTRGSQFHFVLRQVISMMGSGRSLYGKCIESPDLFFNAIDRDADGKITRSELCNAMKRLDVNVSRAQVDDLLFAMDIDGSGDIQYFELTNALRTELHIMEEEAERERADARHERKKTMLHHEAKDTSPAVHVHKQVHKLTDKLTPQAQLYKDPRADIRNSPHARAATPSAEARAKHALRRKIKAAAFRVGGVNWREVFRVFAQEKSKARGRGISEKDLCRGIRRDGHITASLFSDKNVSELFVAIDVDEDQRASYSDFVSFMANKTGVDSPRMSTPTSSLGRPSAQKKIAAAVASNVVGGVVADGEQQESPPPSRVFLTRDGRALSLAEAGIFVEEEFMAAMRMSLRSRGCEAKLVSSVEKSVMHLIHSGRSEKARAVARSTAFNGHWPDGVLFPPDFNFDSLAVSMMVAEDILREGASLRHAAPSSLQRGMSHTDSEIRNEEERYEEVGQGGEDVDDEDVALTTRPAHRAREKKKPAMSFGRRIIDPDDIAVRTGKIRVGRKNTSLKKIRRQESEHLVNKHMGAHSLPWETTNSPHMRDEFGVHEIRNLKKHFASASRSTPNRRRAKNTRSSPSLRQAHSAFASKNDFATKAGEEELKEEEENECGAGTQPLFISSSRRRSLFGRKSHAEVVNRKASPAFRRSSTVEQHAHRVSEHVHAYSNDGDDAASPGEQRRFDEQQYLMEEAAKLIEDGGGPGSPEVVGVNSAGDECYDVESPHNPNFQNNVLSPVSRARATAQAAAAAAAAASAHAAKAEAKLREIERKRAVQTQNRAKARAARAKKKAATPIDPKLVDMSIFKATTHPRRTPGVASTPKSAVKMDMSLRERARHGF